MSVYERMRGCGFNAQGKVVGYRDSLVRTCSFNASLRVGVACVVV